MKLLLALGQIAVQECCCDHDERGLPCPSRIAREALAAHRAAPGLVDEMLPAEDVCSKYFGKIAVKADWARLRDIVVARDLQHEQAAQQRIAEARAAAFREVKNRIAFRRDLWTKNYYGNNARAAETLLADVVAIEETTPRRPNMSDEIPRRIRLDKFTPAERAIWDAIQAVEVVGADPLLTEAVILLGKAKDKVADYVDREAAKR